MKRLGISIFTLLLGTIVACVASGPDSDILMTEGWVRAMLPNSSATSVYGNFINQGTETIEIVGIGSDSFSEVSLHETRIQNGVSRMEPHARWTFAPGDSTELKPGGMHLMLMKPTREILVGSEITLILEDKSGRKFKFLLPVEAR